MLALIINNIFTAFQLSNFVVKITEFKTREDIIHEIPDCKAFSIVINAYKHTHLFTTTCLINFNRQLFRSILSILSCYHSYTSLVKIFTKYDTLSI